MDKSFSERVFSAFGGDVLLVGFSGGADSTAALLLAQEYAGKHGKELLAVHFNHHLRGAESDAEAVAAERFAVSRGVAFLKIDLDLGSGTANLEANARAARLAHWQKLAEKYPGCAVVTGHHGDDKLENLFLRLGRGSNLSGLTGLRADAMVNGVRFLRPLLAWSRCEVEQFLRECGIETWAEDSSNREDFALRNVLRNTLIPQLTALFPGGRQAFMRSLEMLELDAGALESMAADVAATQDVALAETYRELPEAVGCRLLRRLLETLFPGTPPPSHHAVRRFMAAAAAGDNVLIPLDGDRVLELRGGRFTKWETAKTTAPDVCLWQWREQSQIRFGKWLLSCQDTAELPEDIGVDMAVFDAGALPETVIAKLPEAGMKMVPFGKKSPVKLKKLRIDRKIAPDELLPVLSAPDGTVLWYAGVRHSALLPATAEGRKICFKIQKRSKKCKKTL